MLAAFKYEAKLNSYFVIVMHATWWGEPICTKMNKNLSPSISKKFTWVVLTD